MNCMTCKCYISELFCLIPTECDQCMIISEEKRTVRAAQEYNSHGTCSGCSRLVQDSEYISLMGLCQQCARPIREAVSVVTEFELPRYGEDMIAKFAEILLDNDTLQSRVAELEEVLRFYVKEDDGGSRAGVVLGLWGNGKISRS